MSCLCGTWAHLNLSTLESTFANFFLSSRRWSIKSVICNGLANGYGGSSLWPLYRLPRRGVTVVRGDFAITTTHFNPIPSAMPSVRTLMEHLAAYAHTR